MPFSTQPLPERTAIVCMPAESLPEPGSVSPKAVTIPPAIWGSHADFCSSVPPLRSAELTMPMVIEMIERKHGIA